MVYIPKKNEKSVLRFIENYRILKTAIGKASELNMDHLMLIGKKNRHDQKRA